MTSGEDPQKHQPPSDDVRTRAELLPEEKAAGETADPEEQARAVLADSEARVNAAHDPPDAEDDIR
jgi:hypothetical protein